MKLVYVCVDTVVYMIRLLYYRFKLKVVILYSSWLVFKTRMFILIFNMYRLNINLTLRLDVVVTTTDCESAVFNRVSLLLVLCSPPHWSLRLLQYYD